LPLILYCRCGSRRANRSGIFNQPAVPVERTMVEYHGRQTLCLRIPPQTAISAGCTLPVTEYDHTPSVANISVGTVTAVLAIQASRIYFRGTWWQRPPWGLITPGHFGMRSYIYDDLDNRFARTTAASSG